MRFRPHLAIVVLAACSEEELRPAPFDVPLGGDFRGTVWEGSRLTIAAPDGRVLFEGLPPGEDPGDGPPLVGFAARTITTTYEMQYGAFKPTDTPEGPWRIGTKLERAEDTDGPEAIRVADDTGEALATLRFASPHQGELTIDLEPGPTAAVDPDHPETRTALSWGFRCDPTDHFAGFGAQSWDADHRGQTVPTFVTEGGIGKSETDDYVGLWMLQGQRHSSQAPLPEYLARRGYVMVVDSPRRSIFALCSEDASVARVQIDMPAVVHVFDGPTPEAAIERATSVFGRPRMPPRVAFAPWLDAVFGSENVRRVAGKLRDEKIPGSVIWTEDWRGGDWSGDNYALKEEWEVDRTLYPDIEDVADDLHALGFDFHVYFNPFVYEGSKAWTETADQGFLVHGPDGENVTFDGAKLTKTGLLDLDNPEARAWAVEKMRAAMDLGADGWMNDFAEWLPTDAMTTEGPSYESHNLFPVRWQEIAREAIDGYPADGAQRLFFSRSAWLGSPPLCDVFWAGDQRTTFDRDDGLPTVVPMGIGLGIVGISTYGHDIAGYQSANNPGSTKELFFRWTELGAFSPVMRTHHGAQPNLEWSWESDAETTAHFRRYAALHMALVPTLAGLAAEAADTGLPMWRALAIHDGQDEAVWGITDQVLLGSGLMIAPVMEAGAVKRSVYLPAGRWFPFDGGAALTGPTTIEVEAPLSEIPVFARAGTIVPMYPDGVMTLVRGSAQVPDASSVGDDRVVRIHLGASNAFTEDGGLSYRLEMQSDVSEEGFAVTFGGDGAAAELPSCADAGDVDCVEVTEDGLVAHVEGDGTLTLSQAGRAVATFETGGGAADRRMSLVFRR